MHACYSSKTRVVVVPKGAVCPQGTVGIAWNQFTTVTASRPLTVTPGVKGSAPNVALTGTVPSAAYPFPERAILKREHLHFGAPMRPCTARGKRSSVRQAYMKNKTNKLSTPASLMLKRQGRRRFRRFAANS